MKLLFALMMTFLIIQPAAFSMGKSPDGDCGCCGGEGSHSEAQHDAHTHAETAQTQASGHYEGSH